MLVRLSLLIAWELHCHLMPSSIQATMTIGNNVTSSIKALHPCFCQFTCQSVMLRYGIACAILIGITFTTITACSVYSPEFYSSLHQLCVCADLWNLPMWQNDNLVCSRQELQLMSDQDPSLAAQQVAEALLKQVLANMGVHGWQGIIQKVCVRIYMM